MMKSFSQFLAEDREMTRLPWDKDPKIGWWRDHDHVTLYHGTHHSNLHHIAKAGLKSFDHGPEKSWISVTHDPHTAHAYASMHGGETNFRRAGYKAQHVPHEHRVVIVHRVPKKWVDDNMSKHLRGNTEDVRSNLTDKAKYEAHKKAGGFDHEHYAKTELRFKNIPKEYMVGYMKKKD